MVKPFLQLIMKTDVANISQLYFKGTYNLCGRHKTTKVEQKQAELEMDQITWMSINVVINKHLGMY